MIRYTQVFYKVQANNQNNILLTTGFKPRPIGLDYVVSYTQSKTVEQLRTVYNTLAEACKTTDKECRLSNFNALVMGLDTCLQDAEDLRKCDLMIISALKVTFNMLYLGKNRGLLYDVMFKVGLNLDYLSDSYTEIS